MYMVIIEITPSETINNKYSKNNEFIKYIIFEFTPIYSITKTKVLAIINGIANKDISNTIGIIIFIFLF